MYFKYVSWIEKYLKRVYRRQHERTEIAVGRRPGDAHHQRAQRIRGVGCSVCRARDQRRRRAYTPEDIRARLHQRLAEAERTE